jgi:hypothetical protein
LLIVAAFGGDDQVLDWARDTATQAWGPIALSSDRFEFLETNYYEASMGPALKKTFFAFERLIDAANLADLKRQANDWEQTGATVAHRADWTNVARPLNLDPGYMSQAKLVLASTKDHAHRIYLRRGIFAEATLLFQNGAWQGQPWTYPDYRREDYHRFFSQCRDYLRARLAKGATP